MARRIEELFTPEESEIPTKHLVTASDAQVSQAETHLQNKYVRDRKSIDDSDQVKCNVRVVWDYLRNETGRGHADTDPNPNPNLAHSTLLPNIVCVIRTTCVDYWPCFDLSMFPFVDVKAQKSTLTSMKRSLATPSWPRTYRPHSVSTFS